jgi:hypothetical protein
LSLIGVVIGNELILAFVLIPSHPVIVNWAQITQTAATVLLGGRIGFWKGQRTNIFQ